MNSPDSLVAVPAAKEEVIKAKIADLLDALQQQLPAYESLLHQIHRNLAMDPETVHLLSEEEIGVICSALQKRTGVFIAQEVATKKGGKGGRSLSDLM